MKLHIDSANIFVPDGAGISSALSRTTHLAIGAHQDDVEFGAFHGIAECFGQMDSWFTAVICSDGAGSARAGLYAGISDAEMRQIRQAEQRKAAVIGEYAAVVQLSYPSRVLKDGGDERCVEDLAAILEAANPRVVYVHNPADKHDTHVAVFLRTITALRRMAPAMRPERVLGYELWRDLDWLVDDDKVVLAQTHRPNLQAALNGVFDSQISGGKRYDLGVLARRIAHATFHQSHAVDSETGLTFAMDLTPLIDDPRRSIRDFTLGFVERLNADVDARLERLG